METKTLILSIGNVLMTDEAVGAEVLTRLEQTSGADPSIRYLDGGTLSFTLAIPIGECQRLIVIDAAATGEAPGNVRVYEGEAMDRQLGANAKSVHEVSLADLMDIARLTDTLPAQRALVGIEPAYIGWGEQLTPQVAAAVPEAIAAIRTLLARWDDPSMPAA